MDQNNAVGRRKTAIARVYLAPGNGSITINGRDYKEYFPTAILQNIAEQPLNVVEKRTTYDVKANLTGGGIKGQAEAVAHGISRVLVEIDPELRPALKAKGLMRRDPRMVERKKFGQKKARKRFQFSKR